MELSEALGVLSIPQDAERKTARRAYLKLIKKHKPESDPEGFKRVREAWECYEAYHSLGIVLAADEFGEDVSSPGSASQMVPDSLPLQGRPMDEALIDARNEARRVDDEESSRFSPEVASCDERSLSGDDLVQQ